MVAHQNAICISRVAKTKASFTWRCFPDAFKYLPPALWLQKYVIDRVLEDDGATGDQYGPYAPEHIKEERERLKKQKVRLHHTLCYMQ